MQLFRNKAAEEQWPHLSPKDAATCAAYTAYKKTDPKKCDSILVQAVSGKNYAVLTEITPMGGYLNGYARAIGIAVKNEDLKSLQLLTPVVTATFERAQEMALLDRVSRSEWKEAAVWVLPLIKDWSVSTLVNEMKTFDNDDLRQRCLLAVAAKRKKDLPALFQYAAQLDHKCFDALLASVKDEQRSEHLAKVCQVFIGEEGARASSCIKKIIAAGANVNHDNGALMRTALMHGQTLRAQLLLDNGYALGLWGDMLLKDLHSQGAPEKSTAWLQQKISGEPAVVVDGYHLSARDTVSRVIPLPSGGQLTMLFNFTLRQQILLHQAAGPQATAPAVVAFSQLENPQALAEASAAFVKLGGDASLAEGFVSSPVLKHRKMTDV